MLQNSRVLTLQRLNARSQAAGGRDCLIPGRTEIEYSEDADEGVCADRQRNASRFLQAVGGTLSKAAR